ncbi:hypothetical protein [Carp edema virus]|nr:hypothetical protein [Carp edema virus]
MSFFHDYIKESDEFRIVSSSKELEKDDIELVDRHLTKVSNEEILVPQEIDDSHDKDFITKKLNSAILLILLSLREDTDFFLNCINDIIIKK